MSIRDRFFTILEEIRLDEGNPLARMKKHQDEGRHFIAISTERPGLTKKQVRQRNKELVSSATGVPPTLTSAVK